jgi:hypothetical protein
LVPLESGVVKNLLFALDVHCDVEKMTLSNEGASDLSFEGV